MILHMDERRLRWSLVSLWGGVLSPMLVTVTRSIDEVQSLSLGLPDALRAGLPVVGLIVGHYLAQPVSRLPGSLPWWLAAFIGWCMVTALWSAQPQATVLKTVV